MAKKVSSDELKWQAESDANTMMRYQEIMSDKARMGRAIKEAERQAKDLNKRANAMQSAAKMRTTTRGTGRKK
jgi:hypothetical protein